MVHPRASNRSASSAVDNNRRDGSSGVLLGATTCGNRLHHEDHTILLVKGEFGLLLLLLLRAPRLPSVLRLLLHRMVWGDSDWESTRDGRWRWGLGNRSRALWRTQGACGKPGAVADTIRPVPFDPGVVVDPTTRTRCISQSGTNRDPLSRSRVRPRTFPTTGGVGYPCVFPDDPKCGVAVVQKPAGMMTPPLCGCRCGGWHDDPK